MTAATRTAKEINNDFIRAADFEWRIPAHILTEMEPAAVAATGAGRKVYSRLQQTRLVVASMGIEEAEAFRRAMADIGGRFLAAESRVESRTVANWRRHDYPSYAGACSDFNAGCAEADRRQTREINELLTGLWSRPDFVAAAEALLAKMS